MSQPAKPKVAVPFAITKDGNIIAARDYDEKTHGKAICYVCKWSVHRKPVTGFVTKSGNQAHFAHNKGNTSKYKCSRRYNPDTWHKMIQTSIEKKHTEVRHSVKEGSTKSYRGADIFHPEDKRVIELQSSAISLEELDFAQTGLECRKMTSGSNNRLVFSSS